MAADFKEKGGRGISIGWRQTGHKKAPTGNPAGASSYHQQ